MRLIFDGHLDLAWSAVSMNRDLNEPIGLIRSREQGMTGQQGRGNATVSLPTMREGGVIMCLPTVLARARRDEQSYLREDMSYGTAEIAYAMGQAHLAYYRLLEQQRHLPMIGSAGELDDHWQRLQNGERHTIGGILSMEGADPIVTPARAEQWFDDGLRVVSLVHCGSGPYAAGTTAQGGVTPAGFELLSEMRRLGMILDVTHLTDEAFGEALGAYDGPLIATHSNCRALAPHQRQWADEHINRLLQRGAVIGAVLDIWMLKPWPQHFFAPDGYRAIDSVPRDQAKLSLVVDHIDHICQLAGDCAHVAIGTDLDGGFGAEQSPGDLDTIADLQKLDALLAKRGYIDAICHGNWLRFFRDHLPS